MASALIIPVKESYQQLKKELKKAPGIFRPRILMLIETKKAGEKGISKRALMEKVGVSAQSIQTWRTVYKKHGLSALLSHRKGGYKPASFTPEEHRELKKLMNNPKNNMVGYKELQKWVKQTFNKEIKYNTLLKYMIAKFNTRIKVARKTHVLKSQEQVEAFKKTLHRSVRKS